MLLLGHAMQQRVKYLYTEWLKKMSKNLNLFSVGDRLFVALLLVKFWADFCNNENKRNPKLNICENATAENFTRISAFYF